MRIRKINWIIRSIRLTMVLLVYSPCPIIITIASQTTKYYYTHNTIERSQQSSINCSLYSSERRACFSNADPNLTVEHVADVLSLLERNWYDDSPGGGGSLCDHLDVPDSKEWEIKWQHQSQQLQLASLSAYIVQFIPGISWAVIAGSLYFCCEERALQAAKRYTKREEGKLCAGMT